LEEQEQTGSGLEEQEQTGSGLDLACLEKNAVTGKRTSR
jgi:hypothetical protein